MRADSARAALALAQATVDVSEMAVLFSDAFGMEISAKKTPAILNVLKRGVLTMRLAARGPKKFYKRPRPYEYFNESTLIPSADEEHRHTAAQDALLKYGYEWGQSRVIAGFHWQSDVDAMRRS